MRNFLSASLSSMVDGDVFSFLEVDVSGCQWARHAWRIDSGGLWSR